MKNVQISEKLFNDMQTLILHLKNDKWDDHTIKLIDCIETQINDKNERIAKRDMYTVSKVAANPLEREQARQQYLDAAGIHKDWRYSSSEIDK